MSAEAATNEAAASLSSNSRMASPPTAVFAKYIVLMIVAALAVAFFGIKPGLEGYFANNTKTAQQAAANKSNADKAADLNAKYKNLPETEAQVNDFLKSFPPGANQKAMLDELGAIASKNGVTIQSITPSVAKPGTAPAPGTPAAAAPQSNSLVAAINIDMTLTGGNTNGFLSDLEKASRVFVINSLAYTSASGQSSETMSLKATTFVVQPLVPPATNGGSAAPAQQGS